MSKHTPGPWHVGGVFLPGTPDVHCSVWGATPPGCASGDEVAKYVHPKDAPLISAAPQLLEALELVARAGRGTSGRLILERHEEDIVLSAIASAKEWKA